MIHIEDKRKGKLTCQQRNEIAARYEAGEGVGELALAYGIQKKGVRKIIDTRGVQRRPYTPQQKTRRRWVRKNTMPVEDRNAGKAVYRAVKAGKLIRPDTCEVCGVRGKKINGHHDDYNFYLSVRWLCSPCHVRWHCDNIPIARRPDGV